MKDRQMYLTDIQEKSQHPPTNRISDKSLVNSANIASKNKKSALARKREASRLDFLQSDARTIPYGSEKPADTSKVKKYRLLREAQMLISDANIRTRSGKHMHRTCDCQSKLSHKSDAVDIKTDGNRTSFSGLQTCGCVWSCPVCAPKIAAKRGSEIRKALEWAKENGYLPVMVVLTASHNISMSLDGFKTDFRAAWRYFASGGAWKNLKKSLGIEHSIKSVEPIYGENGWHYHQHILIFIKKSLINDEMTAELDEKLTERWLKALKRQGLTATEQHGCFVSAAEHVPDYYLAKLGVSDRHNADESYELSGTENKKTKGKTHWQILEDSARGNNVASGLYIEFVKSMTGDNWITWSHGFKALVGVNDAETDDDIASEDDTKEMRTITSISPAWWRFVVLLKLQANLLSVASRTQSAIEIWEYLYSEVCLAIDDGRLLFVDLNSGRKKPDLPVELCRLLSFHPEKSVKIGSDAIIAPLPVQKKLFNLEQEYQPYE